MSDRQQDRTSGDELDAAAQAIVADSGLFHDIVHGAADDPDVPTEGGNVPPVGKEIARIAAEYEGDQVIDDVISARDETFAARDEAVALNATAAMSFLPQVQYVLARMVNQTISPGSGLNQLSFLATGDSLGLKVMREVYHILRNKIPLVGAALQGLTYIDAGGTITRPATATTDANFQPTRWDTGRIWDLSDASTLEFGVGNGVDEIYPYRYNKCLAWFSKHPGGGEAVIERSIDHGANWTEQGRVSTDVGTGENDTDLAALDLDITKYHAIFRVRSEGGPVKMIGAGLMAVDDIGLVYCADAIGGLRVSDTGQAPATIRAQIFSDMRCRLVTHHFREETAEVDGGEIDAYLDRWLTAVDGEDQLIFLQHRIASDDTVAALVNGIWSAKIASHNTLFSFDTEKALVSVDYIHEIGWEGDTIHLTSAAWSAVGMKLCQLVFKDPPGAEGFARRYFSDAIVDRRIGRLFGRAQRYGFTGDTNEKTSVVIHWPGATGTDSYFGLQHFPADGTEHADYCGLFMHVGTEKWPIIFDTYGRATMSGSLTGFTPDIHNSRLGITEGSTGKRALTLAHTGTGTERIQVWEDSTGECAKMFTGGIFYANQLSLLQLPTTDPAIVGKVWNDGGTLKISAG